MRLVLRLLAGAALLAVLLVGASLADLMFNRGRNLGALLGRDALIEACRPPLIAKLKAAGFDPADVEFDEAQTVTVATAQRTLAGAFTFADGSSHVRVDGLSACVVSGRTINIEVRTRSTPVRAT